MSTRIEKSILVNVPVSVAYNQWTQFEDFPQFMNGIKSVTHISDDRLEWVAELAGVRRKWEAKILEQVPDKKVAWAATEGATNAGEVTFEDLGGGQTSVHLTLEYEPEGLVEKIGDKLNVVENQAEGDLEKFKAFIEAEGYATGAWRGTINEGGSVGTPGVEDADESRGDSGGAGISGKVVAGGLLAAAAAAVGVAAATSGNKSDETEVIEVDRTDTDVAAVTPGTDVPDATAESVDGVIPVDTAGSAGDGIVLDSISPLSNDPFATAASTEDGIDSDIDPDVDSALKRDDNRGGVL